ncbi:MAG: hypothetical protein EOO38_10710 [Cytophagaceae bacterium]|nr:MAG: hypothetical protein EOO38_10710 [Cytophagaceae bacterium]
MTPIDPATMADVAQSATTALLVETKDWSSTGTGSLKIGSQPGAALALSWFDNKSGGTGYGTVKGSQVSVAGRHNAAYREKVGEPIGKPADPKALNNTVFCDGHVKALKVSELTSKGDHWSRTGRRDSAGNLVWP